MKSLLSRGKEKQIAHACTSCRRAKTGCDENRPCKRCERLGLECVNAEIKPRRTACASCRKAKAACDLLAPGPDGEQKMRCSRCVRLKQECLQPERRDNSDLASTSSALSGGTVSEPVLPEALPMEESMEESDLPPQRKRTRQRAGFPNVEDKSYTPAATSQVKSEPVDEMVDMEGSPSSWMNSVLTSQPIPDWGVADTIGSSMIGGVDDAPIVKLEEGVVLGDGMSETYFGEVSHVSRSPQGSTYLDAQSLVTSEGGGGEGGGGHNSVLKLFEENLQKDQKLAVMETEMEKLKQENEMKESKLRSLTDLLASVQLSNPPGTTFSSSYEPILNAEDFFSEDWVVVNQKEQVVVDSLERKGGRGVVTRLRMIINGISDVATAATAVQHILHNWVADDLIRNATLIERIDPEHEVYHFVTADFPPFFAARDFCSKTEMKTDEKAFTLRIRSTQHPNVPDLSSKGVIRAYGKLDLVAELVEGMSSSALVTIVLELGPYASVLALRSPEIVKWVTRIENIIHGALESSGGFS